MQPITVQTTISATLAEVWFCWTEPEHITHWAFASDDWESPHATNDLRVGGEFSTRMQAKDQSVGFDFGGTYTEVEEASRIAYDMADGRHVEITFVQTPDGVLVKESFDPESENAQEMQRVGWQAILDNFKKYVEEIARV